MAKIAVRKTIVETYRYVFGNIGKIIALIWIPAVLTAVIGYVWVKPYLAFMATGPDGSEILQNSSLILGLYGYCLVAMVLLAAIMSAVAREFLQPAAGVSYFSFPPVVTVLRVTAGLLGILGIALVFFMGLGLVLGIVAMVGKAALGGGITLAMEVVLAVVAVLGLIYCLIRLAYLIVPSVVLEGKFGIVRSWHLTAGNFWRIVAVVLATALPIVLVSFAGQNLILGPDYWHAAYAVEANTLSPEAAMQAQAVQMRLMADHLSWLMGLQAFLAPFTYGLSVVPTVIAFRALSADAARQS